MNETTKNVLGALREDAHGWRKAAIRNERIGDVVAAKIFRKGERKATEVADKVENGDLLILPKDLVWSMTAFIGMRHREFDYGTVHEGRGCVDCKLLARLRVEGLLEESK